MLIKYSVIVMSCFVLFGTCNAQKAQPLEAFTLDDVQQALGVKIDDRETIHKLAWALELLGGRSESIYKSGKLDRFVVYASGAAGEKCRRYLADLGFATAASPQELGKQVPGGRGFMKHYFLSFADAEQVASILTDQNRPNVVIESQPRTNSLSVRANQRQHQEIAELIVQLDGGQPNTFTVIALQNIDPKDAAFILQKTFTDKDTRIEADLKGNRLLVRSSEKDLRKIQDLVTALDWFAKKNGPVPHQ